MQVTTFGHGTLGADELVAVLAEASVDAVVDIRRYPGSRRHPHVAAPELERWLPERGIGYRWSPALGGRRKPDPDTPNTGLRNAQFQAYADHMASDEFRAGVAELLVAAAERDVAVMCSESVWWRCHRRLLADHLVLVEGAEVRHLFHDGRLSRHDPLERAVVEGGTVVYRPEV